MAYSDAEKADALIRLWQSRYDYAGTEKATGITARTLRTWEKNYPKKQIGELLDYALQRALMRVDEVPAKDLPIFVGILMDKWLLMQGEPTARVETIEREIEKLRPEETDELIAEARAIIERAKGRAVGAGNTGEPEEGG